MSKRLNLDSFLATLPCPPLLVPSETDGPKWQLERTRARPTATAPGAVKHSVSRFRDHFWGPFWWKQAQADHERKSRPETADRTTNSIEIQRKLPDDKRWRRGGRVRLQNVRIGGTTESPGLCLNIKEPGCNNESQVPELSPNERGICRLFRVAREPSQL